MTLVAWILFIAVAAAVVIAWIALGMAIAFQKPQSESGWGLLLASFCAVSTLPMLFPDLEDFHPQWRLDRWPIPVAAFVVILALGVVAKFWEGVLLQPRARRVIDTATTIIAVTFSLAFLLNVVAAIVVTIVRLMERFLLFGVPAGS